MTRAATILERARRESYTPPLRTPAADWFREHLRLPAEISALGGVWSADAFPFQVGILDAWSAPGVRRVVLKIATQLGKTTILAGLIPYQADVDPGPALWVASKEGSAREASQTRIAPMLDLCERTRPMMQPKHKRHHLLIDLRRMLVFFAWSGSVTTLGEKSIRYLLCTEVDKWADDAGIEADPLSLALNRVKAFPNHKILIEGTPDVEETSRICRAYSETDRRAYHVPCPHCDAYQPLVMDQVKWSKDAAGVSDPDLARESAHYECAKCRKPITDAHKPTLLRRGLWVPEGCRAQRADADPAAAAPYAQAALPIPREGLTVRTLDGAWSVRLSGKQARRSNRSGFHLSSLYSPLLTWGECASAFIEAQRGGRRTLKDYLNGWLAQGWRRVEGHLHWETVRARLSGDHEPNSAPPGVSLVTAGVDVQEWRVFYAIWGWELLPDGWRALLIDNGELEQMSDLQDAVLDREFPGGAGTLGVTVTGMDCRYRPREVHAFVGRMAALGSRILPLQGEDRWRARYTISHIEVNRRTGKPYRGGATLWHVNVSEYKAEIYAALKHVDRYAPGSFNLHSVPSEDFIRQLCAEAPELKTDDRGHTKEVWTVIDQTAGNHYFDCSVYAFFAADTCGMFRKRRKRPAAEAPAPEPEPRRDRPGRTLAGRGLSGRSL